VKHFLITGGAGYLGSSLVRAIVARGDRVRRLFRGDKTPEPLASNRIEDFRGDITSRADLERALADIDVVVHLAAQTSIYVADADPLADLEANIRPMLSLLEACRARGGCPTLVLASTATLAGIAPPLPVGANTPDQTATIYELHKQSAERYLRHYCEKADVRGCSLRLANVFGPGPKSSRPDRGILNGMVRRALAGETLKIYGTGQFLRDYIYVDEAARAFLCAADHDAALDGRHFYLASGTGHTLAEAVKMVARLVGERTGSTVPVEHVPAPPTLAPIETRNFVADTEPLWQAAGFRSTVSLEQGLRQTIDYFSQAEGRT
jgi:UDP-glucose 4-epimerase